jgi:hypothetical protein
MKSVIIRPLQQRPVGWWKKDSPYGGKREWKVGSRKNIFPVSASESPKIKTDV